MTIHDGDPVDWEALPRRGGAVTSPRLRKAPRSTAEDMSEKLAGIRPRARLRSHAGGRGGEGGGGRTSGTLSPPPGTTLRIRKLGVCGIDSGGYLFVRAPPLPDGAAR